MPYYSCIEDTLIFIWKFHSSIPLWRTSPPKQVASNPLTKCSLVQSLHYDFFCYWKWNEVAFFGRLSWQRYEGSGTKGDWIDLWSTITIFTSERAWRRASQWMVFGFLLPQHLAQRSIYGPEKHWNMGYWGHWVQILGQKWGHHGLRDYQNGYYSYHAHVYHGKSGCRIRI